MKSQRPNCIATDFATKALASLLWAALLLVTPAAWAAQVVGVISHLSGPLLDRKLDGSVKVLAVKSEVENGDTLVAEKNTYAQVRFVDNSEITLNPGTTLRIENFAFDAGKPEADSAAFSLVKGGLRSITGLLGKRNKEKFALKTPNATIGIRGTTFIAQWVEPPSSEGQAPLPATGGPALPPGLHLQVTDGAIVVTNGAGAQGIAAGQFGYVPAGNLPPVLVPPNTGLQFVPPPSFNGEAGSPQASNAGSSPDKQAVDCIVR